MNIAETFEGSNSEDVELAVLQESIRARVTVAPLSFFGCVVPMIVLVPVLYKLGVPLANLLFWTLPFFFTLGLRLIYSARLRKTLDTLNLKAAIRVDWMLRISSIVNQLIVGAGIWLIHSAVSSFIPLFVVTFIVLAFAFGVMSNLFSDYLSFSLSAPCLVGQSIIYWCLQDGFGLGLGLSLLTSLSLMMALVYQGSKVFRESVLMRFEKNRLLEEVSRQRVMTQAALDQAQEANRSKAFFMAAASHDIKQPLYALGMLTDTLLMSNLPDEPKSILEKQQRSIQRMNAQFDDLMDLTRFEQGVYQTNPSQFFLRDAISILDVEFGPVAESKNLSWKFYSDNPKLETDPELLVRLLRNLLSNAMRYTTQGSVAFTASLDGDEVDFRVIDTGPGISLADQDLVFQEFVRLNNTEDKVGAGLGLAIVEHIAKALETKIQLKSRPGEGAQFRFSLPVLTQ